MKRLVLVFFLGALLAVPAVAAAGVFAQNNRFQGRVEGDPNTYFGFDVAGTMRHRKVRHVMTALPMACYSGDQEIVEMRIPGSFRLGGAAVLLTGTVDSGSAERAKASHRRHHRTKIFFAEADVTTVNGDGEAEVLGIVRPHGKALGYVHVHTHSETVGKCYSGYLEWKAHRGADVVYPPAP